jgi:hypothetical protein
LVSCKVELTDPMADLLPAAVDAEPARTQRRQTVQRRAAAAARQARYAARQAQGDLLPRPAVVEILGQAVLEIRSKILRLPTSLAPRVFRLKSVPQIYALIDAAVREALSAVAEQRTAEISAATTSAKLLWQLRRRCSMPYFMTSLSRPPLTP